MLEPQREHSGHSPLKKGLDVDESRRKREATTVALRKDKKEENLMQKRRRDVAGGQAPPAEKQVGALPDPGLKAKLDSLPEDVVMLHSHDFDDQLEATQRFRKLMSIERNPPIAEVVAAGVVPRLVQFLQCFDQPLLLFEAAWTLTNISSGTSEHTRVVIDNGAIPIFVQLIQCPHVDVREQAVWALGNIAGDSTRCRDLVLSYTHSHGMLPVLLAAMVEDLGMEAAAHAALPRAGGAVPAEAEADARLTLLRNATWTVSNLCRSKPPPRWELIAPALPVLIQLVHTVHDEEILVDACWALSHVCEPADRVQPLVDGGALPRLVLLLGHASANVQTPALRCIGNVAAGAAGQTQAVIACEALPAVAALLCHTKKEIRKEVRSPPPATPRSHPGAPIPLDLAPRSRAHPHPHSHSHLQACWTLSNVTAGSSHQIDAVCASGVVPRLVEMLSTEEHDILKEAAYALCNACVGASRSTVSALVSAGLVEPLSGLLECPEPELVLAVLEAFEAVLDAGATSAGMHLPWTSAGLSAAPPVCLPCISAVLPCSGRAQSGRRPDRGGGRARAAGGASPPREPRRLRQGRRHPRCPLRRRPDRRGACAWRCGRGLPVRGRRGRATRGRLLIRGGGAPGRLTVAAPRGGVLASRGVR